MVILLIVIVIFLVLLFGMLLAFAFSRMDQTVTGTRAAMAAEERAYNPGLTLGHKIKTESSYTEQLQQARLQAARTAAALPRGRNNRIGREGQSTLATAGQSVKSDPMTAVRIAHFHGWDGARTGAPSVGGIAAPGVVAAGAPAAGLAPPKLIDITPGMAPEEVRKARIANAKAESAYNKALKGVASGAPVAVAGAAPAAVAVAAAPAAGASTIGLAPPKLIEITPAMAPEEVRKARIANAKAESAYNKALKAAGGMAGAAAATAVAQPTPAVAAPVVSPAAAAPTAAGIAPPQLIEITEGMAPEDVRRARVANAKAESAYNKALKAAGVDPAAIKAGAAAPVVASQVMPATPPTEPTPATPAAPTVSTSTAATASPTIPAGITPPQLIEITEGMAPDEVRRARVENAKASAAYNKALKAAGIDPASVK